ncbi:MULTISPECIES: hypothetical protein [Ralstonia solanacearum species complex]|uniref:Uncharacterized protein n=4 Tax=root TaxID=1 RepID=A0A1W5LU14_9VIRU|nr:hypothetical protein [Ralstonia solanacearum]YP_009786100.1 hypothetical protein [Ralstonia phage Rs551]YP_010083975.1 putative structural protein [Ralstonia phage RSIBR3]ALF87513.1 hypothetical protein RSUY_11440 [Ralstonia solanacearum]ANO57663.1 hypothetical protein [Ralstonia phage Rs551]ATI27031.1 hypothetical protein CCY86_05705 [Ralstonia solanacearum]ATJ85798.1 hypothetical protein CDC59_05660 [Ralstonia solanacearum]ATW64830.1 putative structural protein [Ralstonia phage RSIBR3]
MKLTQKLAAGAALAVGGAGAAMAQTTTSGIDFSSMTGAVSATAVVAALVAMGVVKIGPGFAKWALNKVAAFF